MSLFAVYHENLILATDMIKIIGHREEFQKRTFERLPFVWANHLAINKFSATLSVELNPLIHLTCLCVIRQKTFDNKLLQSE